MKEGLKQYLGEGPYPFPFQDFSKLVDMHLGSSMIVFLPKAYTNLPVGTHVHSSYEFLIPLSPMPASVIGTKPISFGLNRLFPINCDQEHGPVESKPVSRFVTFQLEKQFLQDIACQLYGKREILFENISYRFDQDIKNLLQSFVEESSNRQAGHTFIMESLSTQIVINLFRQLKHNLAKPSKDSIYSERENINRAIDFLREYYCGESSLEEVARTANLSTYHFIRVFKAETGKTPIEYLLDIKIDKARAMLMNKNKSITEICYSCGFNNPSHFARVFKSKTGVTPSGYRKSFLGF